MNSDFVERLDTLSRVIRAAEEGLVQEGCLVEVEAEHLKWVRRDGRLRICSSKEDRPLIETKVDTRLELCKHLPGLHERARAKMHEALKAAGF